MSQVGVLFQVKLPSWVGTQVLKQKPPLASGASAFSGPQVLSELEVRRGPEGDEICYWICYRWPRTVLDSHEIA